MIRAIALIAAAAVFTACGSSHPLLGKWALNDKPRPGLSATWTALDFVDATHVEVTYIPALNPFGGMLSPADRAKALRPKTDDYAYDDLGNGVIRIVRGSEAQKYKAEVKDDKLFLSSVEPSTGNAQYDAAAAAAADASATVFVRAK